MASAEQNAQQRGDFRLMRWFALSGAAAIGLFSAAIGLLLGQFLGGRMLDRDAQVSQEFVQSIVSTQRLTQPLRDGSVAQQSDLVEFFAHVAAIPGVLRANVYASDRTVLWSSSRELIGRRFGDNDELDAALAGRVIAHRADAPGSTPPKAEHVLLADRSDAYVELYLPVYDEDGRGPIGVVELYRNQAALFAAIRDGQRLVWASAAAGGLFLFATLIWFVRRAERALREQQGRLVEAEALAIVGELSASVAHSIRNPLGSIRSTAELQRELGADAGAMDDIVRGVDRIDALVSTLLGYAADPAEREASAELDTVVAVARARFEPEFSRQGKPFTASVAGPLGRVAADPVLLAQLLGSLLANAGEATAAGEPIELEARREGALAVVEVRDGGRGIGDGDAEQLFRPFYTTKARGLGMGLALVRRVVRRLGGRIALEPRPGRGTVARIELPVR